MKIVINNKHLEIKEKKMLSTGNVNTYIIDVEYDNTYKGRQLIIYFKNNDVKKIAPVGPDDKVIVPHEVLKEVGTLFVGFYSHKSKDEVLIDRYSSNLDTLPVIEGAYDEDAEYSEELSPNIVEQYLQEMKEFYDKSFKEYNNNASIKLKEYNDNASQKLTEYNNNSEDKLEEYNLNADNKKEEIDKVAEEVVQNKTDIEEIEKRVSASEQNAKASETNAKTSEQSAQNSLNKVTEIETNITGIQEEINQTKEEIDTTKTSIDNSVEEVNRAVTEATNQASESKKQADIAITNANQTSTDKQAAETMKNDISVMKTSVEQTKSATEQIKANTQSIYNNTVDAKNETLEAKETVESSLENERIESDKKYAQAIESDEIVVDGVGQVELDEDGYMKDVIVESNLPDITQEAREGYNLINLNKQFPYTSHGVTVDKKSDGRIVLNGTADANFNISFSEYFEISNLVSKNLTLSVKTIGIGKINNIGLKRYYAENVLVLNNIENDTTKNTSVENFNPEYTNATGVAAWVLAETVFENFTIYLSLVEGTEEKPYEPYGVSPSLDHPSQFENIVKNVDIQNNQENILYIDNPDYKPGYTVTRYGVTFTVQDDLGLKCVGTSTQAVAIPLLGTYEDRFRTRLNIPRGKRIYSYIKNNENNKARIVVFSNNKYTVANNLQDSILTENLLAGYIYAEIVANSAVDCTIYPQLTYEKVDEYVPYNGYNENLALSERRFLGNFNGFKNYIEENKLKGRLKVLTLDGTNKKFVWKHTSIETENRGLYRFDIEDKIKSSNGDDTKTLCNYLKISSLTNASNLKEVDEDLLWFEGATVGIYAWLPFTTLIDANNWLKEKYNAGTPLQILYITNEEYKEDLSDENISKINGLKVYKGINNIHSNCKVKFKSNKYLNNHIEGKIKETVDSERRISDSKYSRALKGKVVDEKFTKIYAENKNVDDLVLKGNEITQETHTSTANILYSEEKYWELGALSNTSGILLENNERIRSKYFIPVEKLENYFISVENSDYRWANIYFYDNMKNYVSNQEQISTINGITTKIINIPENVWYIKVVLRKLGNGEINLSDLSIAKPMITKGTLKIDFVEGYPIMPSLDYSSEIKVNKELNINISKGNLLNLTLEDITKSGVKATNNGDSVTIKGTSTETTKNISFDFGTIELKKNEPISVQVFGLENLSSEIGNLTLVEAGKMTFINFGNKDFSTYTPDRDVIGTFRFYVKPGQTIEVTAKVMAVKGIKTIEEMPEFRKYQNKDYNITLAEGQFLGKFNGYENYIENNKLKGNLKIFTLTGQENWIYEEADNKFGLYALKIDTISASSKKLCTHYKYNSGGSARNSFGLGKDFVRCHNDNNMTLEEWKSFLAEEYAKGTPLQILYITNEEYKEDLSEGTIPKIELIDYLNIISIDNGTFSFEYNKSLYKVLEEKDKEILDLKNQIALNGNFELIQEIVSTTEQQVFEFNNLKLEKAIIYFQAKPSTGSDKPGELVTIINDTKINLGTGTGLEIGKYGRYIIYLEKLTSNKYKLISKFTVNTDSVYSHAINVRENFNLVEADELNKITIKHWNAGTGAGTKVTLYGVRIPGSEENVQALNDVVEENVIEENINNEEKILESTSESEVLTDE